jgi:hypothetical protein
MKRTLLIFLILFIVMQFIQTEKTDEQVDKSLEIKADEQVMTIFKTACYDCHSNEVKYPWYSTIAPFSWVISTHIEEGKKALNFSIWENYSVEKKEEKIKAIYRTVYASMPLQSYLWFHKEADLTKEQRSFIRDWTKVRPK